MPRSNPFARHQTRPASNSGSEYWSNVINLLETIQHSKNSPHQQSHDVETISDSITLVTKILNHLPTGPEDTHKKLVDTLRHLNLSGPKMDKCSDLDLHLRKQFKLYEKKLASTDRDDDDDDDHNDDQSHDKSDDTVTSDGKEASNEEAQTGAHFAQRSTQPKRATTSRQPATLSDLKKGHESDDQSGCSTHNDDNEYESANDDPAHEDNVRSANSTSSDRNEISTSRVANRLVQTVNEDNQEHSSNGNRRHQLHLRSQPPPQHQRSSIQMKPQNNLARGKQQRASISSCSSSDSYASYGSGYASGSGNSTDHEHKQQAQQQQKQQEQSSPQPNQQSQQHNPRTTPDLSSDTSVLNALTDEINNLNVRSVARLAKPSSESNPNVGDKDVVSDDDNDVVDDNVVVGDKEVGDDADQDSQLKQHLSELEQLTDELAKRDRYTSVKQPAQSAKNHFSINPKSDSSNANRVLSTDSNNSSFSSGINSAKSAQPALTTGIYQIKQRASNTSNGNASSDADSRSASATPTSCLQQTTTSNPAGSQASVPPGRQVKQVSLDNSHDSVHSDSSRPANQYKMPSGANTDLASRLQHSKASVSTSSPNKTQSQEPYYHNLFQWEQLVSKGVTRPLLINDLDFTDLRDEDDCDLLSGNPQQAVNGSRPARNLANGEPLTISIPSTQVQSNLDHDSVDSGASTGSPGSRSVNEQSGTPASAPPPLPPPPISPWFNTVSGSRPQSQFMSSPSPPPFDFGGSNRDQSPAASTYSNYSRNSVCVPQNPAGVQLSNTLQPSSLRAASSMSSLLFGNNGKYGNKRKKTMKLFWKEVREDRSLLAKLTKKKTIWDEIKPVPIDTQKLEYLFESKAKDLSLSKSRNGLDGMSQRKVKITVLDAKRSNAINIGMTKLPPMRTIKSAILKMDSSIMNREGIEKILTTMMPTEEEKSRIIEAQLANPDTPLGTAEQFLLNLASISALEARLKLWAFQLDYAQIEKEVAEPLMDLKQAIDEIERSETFRNILGTLLSIGNFLNSTDVKGFQIDYLEKVPEVKDTVHKHSLLHHLCLFIQEKFDPDLSSDLYSEFSAVNRASKVDYTEVAKNLKKMQQDCKASWDHLKIVAKHDGLANLMNPCGTSPQSTSNDGLHSQHQPKSAGKLNNLSKLSMITTVIGSDSTSNDQQVPTTKQMKMKVSDFLTDCAERIMVLVVIHRRVMNRFQKLLVYLGCPSHQIKQTQPQQILKIINEFALEYRTKRERVREMLMRKQQCQHHHNAHGNRWQLNRTRWAGSQQCIDSLSYNNRPCSTASSIASSSYATNNLNCPDCASNARQRSMEPHYLGNQHGSHHRPGSPSASSQISNYSDYLLDQSCCSRQESMTPVASVDGVARRPHSMSVSMFDLQQQQVNNGNTSAAKASEATTNNRVSENELARQKDEQMRQILGGGKSFDGACHDLYQMSHWTSTMARVPTRHPPVSHKQRASSIDCTGNTENPENSFDASFGTNDSVSPKRQSSYYRYLHSNGNSYNCSLDDEQNSDEEILQSLVRTATAKSNHQNGSHSNRSSLAGKLNDSSNANDSTASSRSAKSKILSRFNCDRKSCKYYLLAFVGFLIHILIEKYIGYW